MLLDSFIICPECAGKRCRESRWKSREEKHANPGKVPYRCADCDHRFIATRKKGIDGRTLGLGAAALTVIVMIAVLASIIGRVVEPDEEPLPEVLAVDPVAVAGPDTRQAALEGDTEAQFRLGKSLLYEASLDGRKAAAANDWLLKAAKSGHSGAMIQLGRMYRSGVGALQNYAYSAQWIRKAAESGDAEGMLELARLYRDGIGVEQDLERAYVWFNRAAAMLHDEAARERDSVGRKLSPEQLAKAQRRSEEPPDEFSPELAKKPGSAAQDQ